MTNYFMWDVIIHPCPDFNGVLIKLPFAIAVKAWMSKYMPWFYVDVITYTYHNWDAD